MNTSENKSILEYYSQCGDNVRAYMDLRFKHFTTFMVTIVLFAGLIIKLENAIVNTYISALALIITLLYWTLDYRTSEFLKRNISITHEIEQKIILIGYDELKLLSHTEHKKVRFFKASTVTNLLFLIFSLSWIAVIVILLC